MNISFDWYKIFYYVALNANITAAAEQLYISQPAVSRSIKHLERALGCSLFIRTAKGVTLTAEGELLFQFISKGITQIQLGEERLAAQISLESGEIFIGASDMTLEFYLLPYLEEFHRQYPKIRISVTNGPSPETLKLLADNAIDFGIVSEPISDLNSGYSTTPVREIEDVFISGIVYAPPEGQSLPLDRLSELPLIMLEANTSTRKYVDGFLRENGVRILPEFELATSSLIVQFVKRNLGIGCVVRDFAQAEIASGNIREIKLDKPVPKRHICLVRKNVPVSKASEKLLEILAT